MSNPPHDGEPPQRRAPGRRPPGAPGSRARTGGSAQPVGGSGESRPANPNRSGGRRPPSFAPRQSSGRSGEGQPAPSHEPAGPQHTRVMPAGHPSAQRDEPQRPSRPADPRGPDGPHSPGGEGAPPAAPKPRRKRRGRRIALVLAVLLVLVLAWPVGLLIWANGQIQHVDAGESSLSSSGTTYLLTGSDSRDDGQFPNDSTAGQRADTIMILTVPRGGNTSLISLPRDTLVEIPGHGTNKLNSAFSLGGAPLLRETVEGLTGIEVDHYVEIGMGGLAGVVDAVGGVELCLDYDVDDDRSDLQWTAGCHVADGDTALAFSRMRYSDPLGDIGRTQRQQQVIQAVTGAVADPGIAFRPGDQIELADAGLEALHVSEGSNIIDLGRMALAFRNATGADGVRGAPPIANMDHRPGGGLGSTVLLAEDYPAFFESVADGTVTEEDASRIG